jgi:CubicO group peptidase (beta-lactamase class C family)
MAISIGGCFPKLPAPETTIPKGVEMSSERLQELAEMVEDWIKEGYMVGASYVIMRKGKIAAHEVFGMAEKDEKVPVTKDTIFGVASLSKIVMGTAMMILLDRNEISLDNTIAELLPEFSAKGKGKITVKQLLTHSSGLGWTPDLYVILDLMGKEASEREWKQAAQDAPLNFEPGTAVEYSPQFGPSILKWMAEKVSGQEIEEFCQKHIFLPLGMKDTSWRPPRDIWHRIAKVYDLTGAPYPASLANSEYARTRLTAVWGSLFTTPPDVARLMQAYLNGGELEGHRLLSSDMVSMGTRSHTDSLTLNQMAPADMGFLFAVKGKRTGFMRKTLLRSFSAIPRLELALTEL